MCKKFILWGGTGQARVLHEALQQQGHHVVAIVDNARIVSPLPGVPILYGESGLKEWLLGYAGGPLYGLVAIGGGRGQDRLNISKIFSSLGVMAYTLVHPYAFVAKDVCIGEGSQILAQSAVCTHVVIGKSVIVNTSASVDHDSQIGDGVHIGPGVKIAGEVHVGACAFIGTGAVVLPKLSIGSGAVVGAGAVVTKNVGSMEIVVGNPARSIK